MVRFQHLNVRSYQIIVCSEVGETGHVLLEMLVGHTLQDDQNHLADQGRPHQLAEPAQKMENPVL